MATVSHEQISKKDESGEGDIYEVDGEREVIEASPDYIRYQELCAVFNPARERQLTKKMDRWIIPPLLVIYLLSYIDRSNVGNIKLFGAEADMGLTPTDWNIGLSLLFVTFAIGGPPCNALVKIFGPKKVLSATFLCVGLVVIGMGVAHNRAQWFALRLLLGLFEAGIWPSGVFVLTTWYTPSQLAFRLSIFYLGGTLSGAFSGLLAFGIGQLDGTWGYRGWRWILVVEGVFSVLVAIGAYFWLAESPAKARMFNQEERDYVVLRGRFAYGSNQAGSKDDFTWKDFLSATKSWHVWTLAFTNFSYCVAIYGFTLTLPTIILNMGFSAANAQALSAPPYIFAVFCLLPCGYLSDKYKKRTLAVVIPSCVAFVGLVICLTTAVYPNLVALTYIGVSLTAGGLYCLTPALSAWISLNTAGQAKRAAAISIGVFFTQCGGVVGSNIYIATQRPRYALGFGMSLGLVFAGCVITPTLYWIAIGRTNRARAQITEEEIRAKYTQQDLVDMGDKSPYYKYER